VRWFRRPDPTPEPLAPVDRHQHSWVIVYVRGCAHDVPGPYCHLCGLKLDNIGLSCEGCGLPVVDEHGVVRYYDSEEQALASVRFVGIDIRALTDEQLRAGIREMQEAGLR
jgi:hypothetical protein